MIQTIRGLHHVTAIAIDPQANIDFYTQVLGLRLVKDTVNFDDPSTTLADLFMPLLVANPFSTMRASLRR